MRELSGDILADKCFEKYFVCECNEQACSIAKLVAKGDVGSGTQICLYGKRGVGKTYTLMSIANVLIQAREKNFTYLSGERLLRLYGYYLSSKRSIEKIKESLFQSLLENRAVLLLDEIDKIIEVGKFELLLWMLECCEENNIVVVMGCDDCQYRRLYKIPALEERFNQVVMVEMTDMKDDDALLYVRHCVAVDEVFKGVRFDEAALEYIVEDYPLNFWWLNCALLEVHERSKDGGYPPIYTLQRTMNVLNDKYYYEIEEDNDWFVNENCEEE